MTVLEGIRPEQSESWWRHYGRDAAIILSIIALVLAAWRLMPVVGLF